MTTNPNPPPDMPPGPVLPKFDVLVWCVMIAARRDPATGDMQMPSIDGITQIVNSKVREALRGVGLQVTTLVEQPPPITIIPPPPPGPPPVGAVQWKVIYAPAAVRVRPERNAPRVTGPSAGDGALKNGDVVLQLEDNGQWIRHTALGAEGWTLKTQLQRV